MSLWKAEEEGFCEVVGESVVVDSLGTLEGSGIESVSGFCLDVRD